MNNTSSFNTDFNEELDLLNFYIGYRINVQAYNGSITLERNTRDRLLKGTFNDRKPEPAMHFAAWRALYNKIKKEGYSLFMSMPKEVSGVMTCQSRRCGVTAMSQFLFHTPKSIWN